MNKKTGNNKSNPLFILLMLVVLVVILFMFDLLLGSVTIPVSKVFSALFDSSANDTSVTIIKDFRLPKALTAIVTGAALSVSGLQMQTVFRNPLAGPYVLGISAGASLGVALFVMGFASVFALGIFSSAGAW